MSAFIIQILFGLIAVACYKYGYAKEYVIGFIVFAVAWIGIGVFCNKHLDLKDIALNTDYRRMATVTVFEGFVGSVIGALIYVIITK